MNENVNPDNVNPHFEHPERFGLYPPVSTNVEKSESGEPKIETSGYLNAVYPVIPCPSCGHCPTCGRGPGITYYGPWWGYNPFPTVWSGGIVSGTTSGGEGATVTLGPIS